MSKSYVVAVERKDCNYPIVLVMYNQADGGLCSKSEFARYSREGANPRVESLFLTSSMKKSIFLRLFRDS
jgi:hypothetical protein